MSISKEINNLSKIGQRLSGIVGNVTFNYEEQYLIRRVFKSVFIQIKNRRDKSTAKDILNKTGWIDGD